MVTRGYIALQSITSDNLETTKENLYRELLSRDPWKFKIVGWSQKLRTSDFEIISLRSGIIFLKEN